MSETVRMAVVGCGKIGATHAAAIDSLPGVELVAMCDRTLGKAEALAAPYPGARAYDSMDRMLAECELGAVAVATDHKNHAEPAMQAIRAGVSVIVEKPLTTSLAEAQAMVDAAQEAGVMVGAIFQRRFFPAALRMREAIVAGRLGSIVAAECIAHLGRDRSYFERDAWRGSWAGEGGGVLLNQAIHMVDMLNWMVGTPVEVYGRWATIKHGDYIDVEDVASAVVTYDNGAIATIQAVTTFENGLASSPSETTDYRAPGFRLAVHGTAGHSVGLVESPELSQAVTELWTFDGEAEEAERWRTQESGRTGFPEFHSHQIADFVDAIRAGRPPAVTGDDALRALEIVKGVYLSQVRRTPIALPMSDEDRRAADAATEALA